MICHPLHRRSVKDDDPCLNYACGFSGEDKDTYLQNEMYSIKGEDELPR